jgi:hypothetical protein
MSLKLAKRITELGRSPLIEGGLEGGALSSTVGRLALELRPLPPHLLSPCLHSPVKQKYSCLQKNTAENPERRLGSSRRIPQPRLDRGRRPRASP